MSTGLQGVGAGRDWAEPPFCTTFPSSEPDEGILLTDAFQSRAPKWLLQTRQALDALLELPDGWDSYGAKRIDKERVKATLGLLLGILRDDTPPPSCVPVSDGSVQIEWHTAGVDLEVSVLPGEVIEVSFEDLQTGQFWEGELQTDLRRLTDFIRRLSKSR